MRDRLVAWQQDLIVALMVVTVLSIITMSLVVSREVGQLQRQVAKAQVTSCPR